MMEFCMACGAKLERRFLENEGMIPYCPVCRAFRFPVFSTAVIMIVMNQPQDKILLIQQYGRDAWILVAGYINKGEDAEHAVRREVKEEIGLDVIQMQYQGSAYFRKTNSLMLCFSCLVDDETLDGITAEVDRAAWFPVAQAQQKICPDSIAQKFLDGFLQRKGKKPSYADNIIP